MSYTELIEKLDDRTIGTSIFLTGTIFWISASISYTFIMKIMTIFV